MKTITVNAAALHNLLTALLGNPHEIRELQNTRLPESLFPDNPINVLVTEYNTAVHKLHVTPPEPHYEVCECVEYDGNTQAVYLAGDLGEGDGHYFHTVYRRNPDGTADALQDGELEVLLVWAAGQGRTCYITNDGQRYWLAKEAP